MVGVMYICRLCVMNVCFFIGGLGVYFVFGVVWNVCMLFR